MLSRAMLALSAVLIVALAAVAVAAGYALPPGVRLPMHWNAAGEIDGWGGKWVALLAPVGLALVTTIVIAGARYITPQSDNMARSGGLIRVVWLGLIGLAWAIELMALSFAFHWQVAPIRLLLVAMGLLLVAMGNQFGKTRPMWFVGIRTPWTLTDPDVWIATHRLGGKLFVAAGVIWLAAGVIGFYGPRVMPVLTGILLVAALFPALWSYVLWRRKGLNRA